MASKISAVRVTTAAPARQVADQSWWRRMTFIRAMRLAFVNLMVMGRNILVSALTAGVNAWMVSQALTSASSTLPSRTIFLLWTLGYTHAFVAIVTAIVHSYTLMKYQFIALDGNHPSFAFCVKRFFKGVWLYLVTTTIGIVAVGWALTRACVALPVDKFKLEFYAELVLGYIYSIACDVHLRNIFFHETLQGQLRQRSWGSTRRQQGTSAVAVEKIRRFVRAALHDLPAFLSLLVAGVYVHSVSQLDYVTSDYTTVFMGTSLALKLAVQEIAKHYLVKKNVTNLHVMCAMVCVPTVLIDTQVRVVILASQTAGSTMANSYLMALVEIVFRLFKIARIHWLVKRVPRDFGKTQSKRFQSTRVIVARPQPTPIPKTNSRGTIESWTCQIIGLHIAETYADMYAEYIAIACSGVIALFWSTNPHYTISETIGLTSGDVLAKMLLYQVCLEMVVDYCALTLEIYSGLGVAGNHPQQEKLGSFLGFVVTKLAVININISAILYIRSR